MDSDLQSLNLQYAIPEHVTFQTGPGGLVTAVVKNAHAEAAVTLAGAHVMAYARPGEAALLWTSPTAAQTIGEDMRGGIPICWPWFAHQTTDAEKKPIHGLVRAMVWNMAGSHACPDGSTELRMVVRDTLATRAVWPHAFEMEAVITIGPKLRVEWIARNPGKASYPYTGALHPYFAVSDISVVTVRGLEGVDYLDYPDQMRLKTQTGPVCFGNEVDRVYLNTTAEIDIEDPGLNRTIRISKEGSLTTVVWNPAQIDVLMEDVGAGQHCGFVCVEAANAEKDVATVPAGGEARLAMEISTEQGAAP